MLNQEVHCKHVAILYVELHFVCFRYSVSHAYFHFFVTGGISFFFFGAIRCGIFFFTCVCLWGVMKYNICYFMLIILYCVSSGFIIFRMALGSTSKVSVGMVLSYHNPVTVLFFHWKILKMLLP